MNKWKNLLLVVSTAFVLYVSSADAKSYIIKSDVFACKDETNLLRIIKIVGQGDDDAAKNAMAAGILTDECTFFQKGDTVYKMDEDFNGILISLRKKGEVESYWTGRKAILYDQ